MEEVSTVTTTPVNVPTVSTKQKESVEVSGFLAIPKNLDELFRFCNAIQKSKMVPERFKTPEEVMGAVMFAAEHFPKTPMTAIRQIAMVKGTPTMFGDLPLAKVRASGQLESIIESFFDKDGNIISESTQGFLDKLFGAICTVKRKGEDPISKSFTLDMKDQAGLGKSYKGEPTVWDKYPYHMLKYRARGSALKDVFADVLSGIAQGGYDIDTIDVGEVEVSKPIDKAAQLNEKLNSPTSMGLLPPLEENPK